MRHKIISVMEKNNGEEVSNQELRNIQKLLESKGWENVTFKRVNPNNALGKVMLQKVRDFLFE